MEYRSPLGYNFKLERSLSTSTDERQDSPVQPNQDSAFKSVHSAHSRHHNSSSSRNSYHNSSSPRVAHNNHNWRTSTHRHSNQDSSQLDIAQYFHPSMLEDPWRELELQPSKSD